jgi:hypothetical protein
MANCLHMVHGKVGEGPMAFWGVADVIEFLKKLKKRK